jgi:protein SCO1/2
VQPVFITFDPARDTPEVLADYVGHFHPRLLGLTGTPEEIAAATHSYGVLFERDDDGSKAVDSFLRHTALTYLIGPEGKGLTTFGHDSNAKEMADEILALMAPSRMRLTTGGSP